MSVIINGLDISTIKDTNDLQNLLDEVEDFDQKKLIRARLRQVKDGEKEERNALLNRLENKREESIQKKLQDTMEQKQRYLTMYNQMAKQPNDRKVLDISLYKDNTAKKVVSAKDKFKMMDQAAPSAQTKPAFATSANSKKDNLLKWVIFKTRGYPNVNVQNFSSSFADGLAFCALIHAHFPSAFDFSSLDANDRRKNFQLAFKTAEEKADICPLLDVDDMVMMKNKPDPKCIFTYIEHLYRTLRKFE